MCVCVYVSTVAGVDQSPVMISYATDRLRAFSPRASLRHIIRLFWHIIGLFWHSIGLVWHIIGLFWHIIGLIHYVLSVPVPLSGTLLLVGLF